MNATATTQDNSYKIQFKGNHMVVNINNVLVKWDKSELIGSYKKGSTIVLKNKAGFKVNLDYENESILLVELSRLRLYRLKEV